MDTLQTAQLIALVERNPPLWCKSSQGYRDAQSKNLAWEVIGSSIKPPVTGPAAAKRFKSLRDKFNGECKKEAASRKIPSGSFGVSEKFNSKWPFYSALEFLRGELQPRKTTSNMTLKDAECLDDNEESVNNKSNAGIVSLPSWFQLPEEFMQTTELSEKDTKENFKFDSMSSGDDMNNKCKVDSPQSPPSSKLKSGKRSATPFFNEEDSEEEDSKDHSEDGEIKKLKRKIRADLKDEKKTEPIVPQLDAFASRKKKKCDQWGEGLVVAATKTVELLEKITFRADIKPAPKITSVDQAASAISYSLSLIPEKSHIKCLREMLEIAERYQE